MHCYPVEAHTYTYASFLNSFEIFVGSLPINFPLYSATKKDIDSLPHHKEVKTAYTIWLGVVNKAIEN